MSTILYAYYWPYISWIKIKLSSLLAHENISICRASHIYYYYYDYDCTQRQRDRQKERKREKERKSCACVEWLVIYCVRPLRNGYHFRFRVSHSPHSHTQNHSTATTTTDTVREDRVREMWLMRLHWGMHPCIHLSPAPQVVWANFSKRKKEKLRWKFRSWFLIFFFRSNFGVIIHLQRFAILFFQQVRGTLALRPLRRGCEGWGSQVTEADLNGRGT